MLTVRELKSNPLSIEKLLTDARIPKIIENIKGQTIIYTEYVTEIIEKIKNAVEQAGFTYALYTGEMKDLQRFKDTTTSESIYRLGHSDTWACKNCKIRDDKWGMQKHICRDVKK